jgi:hypothetical protein
VVKYDWEEGKAPHLELIRQFVDDLYKWLEAEPQNVAAIHCSNGVVKFPKIE